MSTPDPSSSGQQGLLQRHSIFWFNDGSLILRVHNTLFKVHRELLYRHSRFLSLTTTSLSPPATPRFTAQDIDIGKEDIDLDRCAYLLLEPKWGVRVEDAEALMEHLYHDSPLSSDSPFSRVSSLLRISSPEQLDFPEFHKLARGLIEGMFPSGPIPFSHPDCLEQALALATEYQITSIRKGLFYSLVTTSNFDTEGDTSTDKPDPLLGIPSSTSPTSGVRTTPNTELVEKAEQNHFSRLTLANQPQPHPQRHILSTLDAQRCTHLMTQLIDYFTPILFTPATTPHMACTDVFADSWMPLVIQPALENDGVYKPLETLERMKGMDWASRGLCEECVNEKCQEWKVEQEIVWRMIDGWLGLQDNTER